MGIVYGALTALSIGLADLFGRRAVNARGPIVAGAIVQSVAILTSFAAVGLVASEFVWSDIVIGLASGIGLGVGLWGYFSGLERSSSTVVAPVVATMSAVLPYAYAVIRGAAPTALAVVGAGVALVGLVVITLGGGRTDAMAAGLRFGAVSGLGYGFGLSVVIEATDASGAWPSVGQRIAAFALMVVIASRLQIDVRPPAGLRLVATAGGVSSGCRPSSTSSASGPMPRRRSWWRRCSRPSVWSSAGSFTATRFSGDRSPGSVSCSSV